MIFFFLKFQNSRNSVDVLNTFIFQLVNICSNDGQRLFDACAIGPLLFGGPIVLLYGTVYSAFLIGPWALIGSATFIAFYPFMVCL